MAGVTLRIARLAGLALLVACSGGGGGSSPTAPRGGPAPGPTPPVSNQPVWTPGRYAAASEFKDRCAVPRTGVDLEGNRFPDRQGSILEENFWLRSWTHETYLWADEVADRDPGLFDDPVEYFGLLRTDATTPSGTPKDDFHFSQPTEDYLRQRNSAPEASYGARLAVLERYPPRVVRVAYTDPGTPAETALRRGDRILSVDGVDVVNGGDAPGDIDTINEGLFPQTAGETHRFEVEDAATGAVRTVVLTAQNLTDAPVNTVSVIKRDGARVGYLLLNTFSPYATEGAVVDAMRTLQGEGVSDLVLDLRYNGGGLLAIASQLSHMIAGPAYTDGQTFERLRFNAGAGTRNPVTGEPNDPIPFFDTGLGFSFDSGAPLPTLRLPRVYVLTTEATCSASEAVINGLRGVDVEVVQIGGTTCGKPYGFYPEDNCGETYYTIQFQGVNDKGFGDYADGFAPIDGGDVYAAGIPGCAAEDDFGRALGDEREALLAAALGYRETGRCPSVTTTLSRQSTSKPLGLKDGPAIATGRHPPSRERDMRLPDGRL